MKSLGKIALILTIIFVVSTAVAIATGPVVLFNGFETTSVYQAENASIQGINELNINVYDPDVNVYTVSGNELQVTLSGTYAKNQYYDNMNLSVEKSGNSLLIKVIYPNNKIILINKALKLDIGVPENYSGDLNVQTTSGDVRANNMDAQKLYVKSTSGDVRINNLTSLGDSYIETTSGDIRIMNLTTESSEYKSTSGEIILDNTGKINSAQTTSGDIKISEYYTENDADFESTSGDVKLGLINGSSVSVEFHSISGDLRNSYGEISNGNYNLYVRTTSGDLKIY